MRDMRVKFVLTLSLLLQVCVIGQNQNLAKFVGKSHNISSGAVRVEDGVIVVEDFHYNGLSPDAHFLIGTGAEPNENGTQIADESGSAQKLRAYHGENITLHLPEDVKIEDFDWLSVWCGLEKEDIGHVILTEKVDKISVIQPMNDSKSLVEKLEDPEISSSGIIDKIGNAIIPPLKSIGKFTTLAHNVSSDDVYIVNDHTIFIANFNYDGKGRDAFFWVGQGSVPTEVGSIVLFDNMEQPLIAYSGANLTLVLPDDISVQNIDWLSVWCVTCRHDFGHVIIKENDQMVRRVQTPVQVLPEFSRLAHGLRSGNISILDEKTILIPDLYYDGEGPDAHFWVGTKEQPDEHGQEVPYKDYVDTLPAFNGETVTLVLPEGLTVNDIEYLGVWCIQYKHNFGYVSLHPEEFKPAYVVLEPFKQLAHGLRSGPILVIDERTFFITNLFFDGKAPDAYFWVGRSKNGPDSAGRKLANELNSSAPLTRYEGEDVYIKLPPDLTVHDVTYFGMFCIQFDQNFGYTKIPVDIPKMPEPLGYHEYNEQGKYIARMPKCCPIGKMKTTAGCVRSSKLATPLNIYEGNASKLNDEKLIDVVFEPYYYHPTCEHGMFSLDPMTEHFYLLTGGLLILNDGAIVTKDSFCTDTNHFEDDETNEDRGWHNTAFICFVDSHPPEFLNTIIASCIYVSAVFLILTSVVFLVFKEAMSGRGMNVIGYSTFMAMSFICLATARIFHVMGRWCFVLGFIYQFFLISSFTWLFCLTYETYYRVIWCCRKYKSQYKKKRFYIYSGVALGLPVVAVIISFFIDSTIPNRPNQPVLGYEPCWFRSEKKVVFYFVPIGVSIMLNIIYCVIIWSRIKEIDARGDPMWRAGRADKNLKNIFRSCYLLLVVMTLCWSAEVLSYFFETRNGFWLAIDIIDSLQGLFVFLIFIVHNPVIEILKRNCNRARRKSSFSFDEITELRPVDHARRTRPPTSHKEALTKIHHWESNEHIDEEE